MGIISSALAFEFFPKKPKSVRLMNTGDQLKAEIADLPEYAAHGIALTHLHITGIPIDDLADEPIVIEIDW